MALQMQFSAPLNLGYVPIATTTAKVPAAAFLSNKENQNGIVLPLMRSSRERMSVRVCNSASTNAGAVASRAMSDFGDLQARRFRDDMMIIMDRDGFPAEIRAPIADICVPIYRKYAAAYEGTVPPEPFVEMRRALEKAQIERWQDVLCAAIGWARWNMAKDFRIWSGKPEQTKTVDPKAPDSKNFDPKSKN